MKFWQALKAVFSPVDLWPDLEERHRRLRAKLKENEAELDLSGFTLGAHFQAAGDHIRNAMGSFDRAIEQERAAQNAENNPSSPLGAGPSALEDPQNHLDSGECSGDFPTK